MHTSFSFLTSPLIVHEFRLARQTSLLRTFHFPSPHSSLSSSISLTFSVKLTQFSFLLPLLCFFGFWCASCPSLHPGICFCSSLLLLLLMIIQPLMSSPPVKAWAFPLEILLSLSPVATLGRPLPSLILGLLSRWVLKDEVVFLVFSQLPQSAVYWTPMVTIYLLNCFCVKSWRTKQRSKCLVAICNNLLVFCVSPCSECKPHVGWQQRSTGPRRPPVPTPTSTQFS